MTVLAVGSIALDTVQTPGGHAEEILGGSATYFALAACRFAPVRLVSIVGEDFPGESLALFERAGIDTRGVDRVEGETFRWSGRYLEDMNRRETLSLALNVFAGFDPVLPEESRHSEFVFLANGSPALQARVLDQVPGRRFALLDTMDHWIEQEGETLRGVLSRVDGLVINDDEARRLSGRRNLIAAGRALADLGPKVVLLKKGEHGSLLFGTYVCQALAAFPLDEVVDPTGAGDSFAGGVMGHLARGGGGAVTLGRIRKAMIYGTVMASFCVERFGPERLLEVTDREIEERVEDFIRFTTPG